jgi:hypothetical protein
MTKQAPTTSSSVRPLTRLEYYVCNSGYTDENDIWYGDNTMPKLHDMDMKDLREMESYLWFQMEEGTLMGANRVWTQATHRSLRKFIARREEVQELERQQLEQQ